MTLPFATDRISLPMMSGEARTAHRKNCARYCDCDCAPMPIVIMSGMLN